MFRPLGMTASSCDMKSFVTAPDAAALHRRTGGKIVVLPVEAFNGDDCGIFRKAVTENPGK